MRDPSQLGGAWGALAPDPAGKRSWVQIPTLRLKLTVLICIMPR